MTKTIQAVAFALSVLVTFGTVAGANGLASKQYAAAERVAASDAAVQRVVVVGRMDAQRVIVVGHRATA
ncbi:MAG TPA: hypothetical protein VES00_04500 [Burkholderiaceae bacterium]|jgi:hypothetical protein|nr:hypothetical protein [Burkholderiaceae bacterium]